MVSRNAAETTPLADAKSTSAAESSTATVLLLCVKYGADKETEKYLESVRGLRGQQNLQVLVVDNMVDSSPARWLARHNCATIHAPENLGYFGGGRYGLSHYLRQNPLPDWIIVSNVDLAIADPDFLLHLASLSRFPRLGAVAPRIRSALTGRDQNPFMRVRPSPIRMHVYKWLFRSWLVLNTYELASAAVHKARGAVRRLTGIVVSRGASSRQTIYAPHGSFLILSKNYFARGGDLEFPEFLFGEEIYIAESMKNLGLEVLYEPSLEVLHNEHRSTNLLKSRKMAAYVAAAAAYCADKFFPLTSRTASSR